MFKKLRYNNTPFLYSEFNYSLVKGCIAKIDGMIHVTVNVNMSPKDKSKVLHRLIKGKNLMDIQGHRRRELYM